MHCSSGNDEASARSRKPLGVDDKTAWFVGPGLFTLSERALKAIIKLLLATPGELENKRIDAVSGEEFLCSDCWLCWRTMFAFEEWHSALEMTLCLHRFIHHKRASRIHWRSQGVDDVADPGPDGLVFMAIGPLTENSDSGDHHTPARFDTGPAPAWDLWRRMAARDPAFGRPDVFGATPSVQFEPWTGIPE